MITFPIITSIIFGFIFLVVCGAILVENYNKNERTTGLIIIAICTWTIISSWILYLK